MLNAEDTGWLVMAVAAAVLVGFVLVEWGRYAMRARNMRRVFANSRAEGRPVPQWSDATLGRGAEIPRGTGVPAVARRFPASPAAPTADSRK